MLPPSLGVVRQLRDLVVRSRDGADVEELQDVSLHLEVTLPVGRPDARGLRQAARALARQVTEQVSSQAELGAAILPGRVFCMRCGTARCEHAVPPSALAVLEAYEPSGRPRWTELTSVLATRRDARVDWLLRDSPGLVACVVEGGKLVAGLLPEFSGAARGIHILGQVATGFFVLPDGRKPPQRFAVTFQAVGLAAKGHRLKVVLNPVGLLPDGGSLAELMAAGEPEGLLSVVASARLKLEGLVRRKGRELSDLAKLEPSVLAILREMARDVERVFNDPRRRTRHARTRVRSGDRPTAKAFAEALSAADDEIRHDASEGTIVVLGKGLRVHVFTREGRHVTSVNYPRETIRIRTEAKRWRPSTHEERESFREALQQLCNGGGGADGKEEKRPRRPPAGGT
ncbi:MAG: hypothetical protein AB1486_23500 [Planctomycetota bacterium]